MKIQVLLFFSSLALFAVAQDAAHLTQADVEAAKAKMDDLCTGDTWNATMTELRAQYDQLKADKKAIEDMVDGEGAEEEQDDPAHDDAVFKKWVQKDGTYNSAVAACKGAKINFYATQDKLAAQNKPQDDNTTTEPDVPAPETAEATATPAQMEKPQGTPTTYTTSQADAPAKPSQSDPSSASSIEIAGGLLLSTMALVAAWGTVG